jgi:hypothetical protein
MSGFKSIEITDHTLPEQADAISDDITSVLKELDVPQKSLPILHVITAQR